MHIVIINGPNLNLLGTRAPDVYGTTTLSELEDLCRAWAADDGDTIIAFQSNHEGDIVDRLHAARTADGIVINPGALTHYSYAIRDAIEAIEAPTVEVHISNIRRREPWRRTSVVSEVCATTIFGRGVDGYRDAMRHLAARRRWPVVECRYGEDGDAVGDLRLPAGPGPHPVVVLLHGRAWEETSGRDLLDRVAVDLTSRGWATWNVDFPGTGGEPVWNRSPEAVADAVAALEALAADHPLDLSTVVAVGHGSGGHLALLAAANPGSVPVKGVVGLAPIGDLIAAQGSPRLTAAVEAFTGGTPGDLSDRYDAASPVARLPLGVPLIIIHGDRDQRVPVALSRSFAGAAADAGDPVVYHEVEGAGHADLIDPSSAAWSIVLGELDRLSS